MKHFRFMITSLAVVFIVALIFSQTDAQPEPDPFGGRRVPSKTKTAAKKTPSKTEAPSLPSPKKVPLDPSAVTLHLTDGSVIAGKLMIKTIEVKTQFGNLTVPIANIVNLTPGLDSHTDRKEKISGLIEKLGNSSYSEREKAQKALLDMGIAVQYELKKFANDKDAERRKNIKIILEKLQDISAVEDDPEDSTGNKPWQRHDTLVTTAFTIAGDISPKVFQVQSKYGQLTVRLNDIKRLERPIQSKKDVYQSLDVSGSNLVQRLFKKTRIILRRGDKVTILAEGKILMTPWGSSSRYTSTPDGESSRYGWYIANKIPAGALVARIGSSLIFKVGSQLTFTAKADGILQFAVAMNPSYSSTSYHFPGSYQVKVRVFRK